MVYANKEERIEEKDVCAFILTRVLNQNNLSKITGITTKSDLEKRANLKRLERQREAAKEAEKFETATQKFDFLLDEPPQQEEDFMNNSITGGD